MSFARPLVRLLPLWGFIVLFKFGAALHYTLLPALGERILPVAVVGALVAATALLQLFLDVPAGFLLDRYGYVRFLRVSTVVFIAAAVALLAGLSVPAFLATLVLSVVGWLFYEPGINAYLLAHVPAAIAGRAIGTRDVMDSLGVVLAAVAITFVIAAPVPTIGIILIIILAIAALVLTFVPRDTASVHAERKHPTHHYLVRRTFLHHAVRAFRRLRPASALLMLAGFSASAFYGIVWFVIPIAISRQEGSGIPGIGLGVFDFAIVLVGALLGRLADRTDRQRLIFFGLLLFATAGAALGFSAGIWFLVLGFLATTGDELASTSLWAWLYHLDKDHAEDVIVAASISMVHDLGWTVGPLVAGFLLTPIGTTWTIVVGAGFVFAAWVVYAAVLGPRRAFALAVIPRPPFPRPHRRRHKR